MQFVNSYSQVEYIIKEHEANDCQKYVSYLNTKSFFEDNVELKPNMRIHWHDDVPYLFLGRRHLVCHYGKDLNKTKKAKRKYNQVPGVNKYKRNISSKKFDCPASIYIRKVLRLPDYTLTRYAQSEKKEKDKNSKMIREKLFNQNEISGEFGYIFKLPTLEDHKNHIIDDSVVKIRPVDERVKNYIYTLVQKSNKLNGTEVSYLLSQYVKNELLIEESSAQFYPNIRTVRKIINDAKNCIKQSKMDQQNVYKILESISVDDCHFYFKPYNEQIDSALFHEDNTNDAHSNESELLFVYCTKSMQELYDRYGCNGVLLDPIYKSTRDTLSLYFLVVQTNVNFQVVCMIITQFGTTKSLTEALTIFKDWNSNISPKYGLVDATLEGTVSLQTVFPDIQIFISTFHRERSWTCWISQNHILNVHKKDFLKKMRTISDAITLNELQQAINDLKSWGSYSTLLKRYFESKWEQEIKRWTLINFPLDMLINTYNSQLVEELKYKYLENYRNCSLSEIVQTLIENYFPERFEVYIRENLNMSHHYYKYDDVSEFLYDRPKWLIEHYQEKLNNVSTSDIEAVTNSNIETGKFKVPFGKNYFVVQFNSQQKYCSCSCKDFHYRKLVCEHIIMVGLKYPVWSLKNQKWILNNPIFKIDENVVNVCEKDCPFLNKNYDLDDQDSGDNTDSLQQPLMDIDSNSDICETVTLNIEERKDYLIQNCISELKSIETLLWNLNEEHLESLHATLKTNFKMYSDVLIYQ